MLYFDKHLICSNVCFSEEVYQSLRSYKAESDDELSFDVGVLIRISQKTLDGWWYGR